MSCGNEDAEKDVVTPATPRYRARPDWFFDKAGRALVRDPYPKGC
jgi:hypothetical protein